MSDLTTEQILLLLAPVILIQLGLMIVALIDLERDERRVRGGSKLVWALVDRVRQHHRADRLLRRRPGGGVTGARSGAAAVDAADQRPAA